MATTIEKTGKTIEDALKAALEELGVEESAIEYEVLENPSKKLFGLLTSPAKIRVTVKAPASVPSKNIPAQPVEEKIAVEEKPAAVESVAQPSVDQKEESTVEKTPTVEESTVEEAPPVEGSTVEESTVEETPTVEEVDVETIEAETIERASKFLQDMFDAMKIKVEIEGWDAEEGYVLSISGDRLGILIGKHGQTLDALQYIVNLAANRQQNHRMHFVLDVEGYREKRSGSLRKLAKSLADRAIKMRKEVRLEPMSRYERKVIHLTLQDNPKVMTHSAGSEPYRYVIITPKKAEK